MLQERQSNLAPNSIWFMDSGSSSSDSDFDEHFVNPIKSSLPLLNPNKSPKRPSSSKKKSGKLSESFKDLSRATTAKNAPTRATTACKSRHSTKLQPRKEFPERIKFPLKSVSMTRPQTAVGRIATPLDTMNLGFLDFDRKNQTPEILKYDRKRYPPERPLTGRTMADWDSRPHTARLKPKEHLLMTESIYPMGKEPKKDRSIPAQLKILFKKQKYVEDHDPNKQKYVEDHEGQETDDELMIIDHLKAEIIPHQSVPSATPLSSKYSVDDFTNQLLISKPVLITSEQSKTISAHFFIINGHIVRNGKAFKDFLELSKETLHPIVLDTFLGKLQHFANSYQIPYAECSVEKIMFFLTTNPSSWNFINKEVLCRLMQNSSEVESIFKIPGRRYQGHDKIITAVLKIQGTYRMHLQRKKFQFFKFQKRCSAVIINYLRGRLKRRKRLQQQAKLLDAAVTFVKNTSVAFASSWDKDYLNNPDGRTVLMLNSLSFGPRHRARMKLSMEIQQKNNHGRLCQLLQKGVNVIYVTLEMTASEKSQLKHLVSLSLNYDDLIKQKRLVMLEIARPAFFYVDAALSTILLLDDERMDNLRKMIATKKVYMEPLIAAKEEARICEASHGQGLF